MLTVSFLWTWVLSFRWKYPFAHRSTWSLAIPMFSASGSCFSVLFCAFELHRIVSIKPKKVSFSLSNSLFYLTYSFGLTPRVSTFFQLHSSLLCRLCALCIFHNTYMFWSVTYYKITARRSGTMSDKTDWFGGREFWSTHCTILLNVRKTKYGTPNLASCARIVKGPEWSLSPFKG